MELKQRNWDSNIFGKIFQLGAWLLKLIKQTSWT